MYVKANDAIAPAVLGTSAVLLPTTKGGSLLSIIAITGMVVGTLIIVSTLVRLVVKRTASKA